MMHPHSELRYLGPEIGFGVFATRPLPRGTITWALDEFDQVLPPERVAALSGPQRALVEEYAYLDAQGHYVLCWDHGRYVNHGCDPTSRGVGPIFEVAVRDVAAGEQLTSDYAELNITGSFTCLCGSPHCRDIVRPDDLQRHGTAWDEVVAAAVLLLGRVEQPLEPFVRADPLFQALLAGPGPVPPRRHYLFPAAHPTADAVPLVRGGLWRLRSLATPAVPEPIGGCP
jgi:hypothetical protein